MKFIKSVCVVVCLFVITTTKSQSTDSRSLGITLNKTTSLVFPFAITTVDRGSRDVLAQKAKGVENVLQLKAGRKAFPETNLTIITADGKLHMFTVNYCEEPTVQTLLVDDIDDDNNLILSENSFNAKELTQYSKWILDQKSAGNIERVHKHKMSLALKSIYIHDVIIYYRIAIRNRSGIGYDIKSLKFYIKDQQKVKRTATQEVEVKPLYIQNEKPKIPGYASNEMVVALRKFTIPDAKKLQIDLLENEGGRNLEMSIGNREILGARQIIK
jgi:conjugative transposon TraN protein